jgi:aspartate ammonia-lyase
MALALWDLATPALDALDRLADAFLTKATEYDRMQRLGRTCLQDAVPLTVGQTHRTHAAAIRRAGDDLRAAITALREVPLGATAIGTGIGAPAGYPELAVKHLAALTGRELVVSQDLFNALSNLTGYSAIAGACSRAGMVLAKIAADLRLLSSGPVGGLGEVTLPVLQAGSSIMPGKVNPVIPELVIQLSYRIRGAAHTVDLAVAAGELELNVWEPVILDALVNALGDLANAATSFVDKCVRDLQWNTDAVQRNLAGSVAEFVEMAGRTGYEAAVAHRTGTHQR